MRLAANSTARGFAAGERSTFGRWPVWHFTALAMCWLKSGVLLIAVFSFFLALTRYSVLRPLGEHIT